MFHSTLPQQGRKPGGVDVFVHRLGQRLVMRGHEVQMISLSPAPAGAQYAHYRLTSRTSVHRIQRIVTVPWMLNHLQTRDLDVLHLHGDDWFFIHRNIPTIRSFYGSALHEARHATRMRRRVAQAAIFGLELVSARLATCAYSVGPGSSRMYALSGTLDCGVEHSPRRSYERSNTPSILFVGTWDGRKRGRLLYDTFIHQIRTHLPDAELWMVSDKGVTGEGVQWLYGPSDEELAALYGRAWVFCLPSTYEGFGIPYLEAMAQGTPVVTSPNIGARYVLGASQAGIMVNDDGLGASILRFLTDRELRERVGRAGCVRARDFEWDRVVAEHEDAYDHTITAWNRGSC